MTGFALVRFHGGPWDGDLSRVQLPLPGRLIVPIIAGKPRTWLTDRTEVTGAARYELRTSARRLFYAIVEEDGPR